MNCNKCKHSSRVIGSGHHLKCNHPVIHADAAAELMALMSPKRLSVPQRIQMVLYYADEIRQLKLKINPDAIMKGYVMWPGNFDAAWISSCNEYKEENANHKN